MVRCDIVQREVILVFHVRVFSPSSGGGCQGPSGKINTNQTDQSHPFNIPPHSGQEPFLPNWELSAKIKKKKCYSFVWILTTFKLHNYFLKLKKHAKNLSISPLWALAELFSELL